MTLAAVRSKAMVLLSVNHFFLLLLPLFFFLFFFFGGGGGVGVVFGPYYVVSSGWRKESWLLYFNCLFTCMPCGCLVFCAS